MECYKLLKTERRRERVGEGPNNHLKQPWMDDGEDEAKKRKQLGNEFPIRKLAKLNNDLQQVAKIAGRKTQKREESFQCWLVIILIHPRCPSSSQDEARRQEAEMREYPILLKSVEKEIYVPVH